MGGRLPCAASEAIFICSKLICHGGADVMQQLICWKRIDRCTKGEKLLISITPKHTQNRGPCTISLKCQNLQMKGVACFKRQKSSLKYAWADKNFIDFIYRLLGYL